MSVVTSVVLVCPHNSAKNVRLLNSWLTGHHPYVELRDVTRHAGGREPENEVYLCRIRDFSERDEFVALFKSLNWVWKERAILTLADSDNQESDVIVWKQDIRDSMDAPRTMTEAARKIRELRGALQRQADNMAFLLNHVEVPQKWREKYSAELRVDSAVLKPKRSPLGSMRIIELPDSFEIQSSDGTAVNRIQFDDNPISGKPTRKRALREAKTFAGRGYMLERANDLPSAAHEEVGVRIAERTRAA
jgi:hypothetical protein